MFRNKKQKIVLNGNEKILIIPQSGMGDNIMMLPVAYNLRRQFPDIELHFLSNEASGASTVASFSKIIDKIHVFKMKEYTYLSYASFFFKQYFSIIRRLRSEKYDYVISVNINPLIISILLGLYPVPAVFENKNSNTDNWTETCLKTLEYLDLKVSRDWEDLISLEESKVNEVLKKYRLPEKYICLNFYAKSPGRTYLKMKDVARALKAADHSVVLLGTNRKHKEGPEFIDLINKTSLLEAAAILKKSTLFITVDNGLMHMAFAFHVPTIALFGYIHSNARKPVDGRYFFTKFFNGRDSRITRCGHSGTMCINKISESDVAKEALKYLTQKRDS